MPDFNQPSEIAREVLLRLAQRRIQPTPDNYLALYHEITGKPVPDIFPEKAIKSLAAGLPRHTAEQVRVGRKLDQAASEKSWDHLRQTLTEVLDKVAAEPPAWSALIRDLLSQLEIRSTGLTTAQKKEALDHVLAASGNPEVLYQRLTSLLKNWSGQPGDLSAPLADRPVALPVNVQAEPTAERPAETAADNREWRELIAQILDNALPPLLHESPELATEAAQLSAAIRAAGAPADSAQTAVALKKFIYRLQFVAEDQAELRASLLGLLRLLVENIDELVVDDQWIQGQIAVVSDLISQPLTLRRLDDVGRRVKDLIYKQSALKKHLNDARDRLKIMLATFVDRLADMSAVTGDYHDKIERCATRISQSNDIGELTDVLDEVMRETRTIQLSTRRSHDELTEMKSRASDAEKEIARLQQELANASDMVRHDALTGALNRKGMDETLEQEVSRSERQGTSLCIAMLDIDNFKKLNDTLGHDAGDEALKHLTGVVKETIRPQDTLARYGGEEFVVLLPDTRLENGVNAMVRVQRELTRKFFLHQNDKVLITFSCGVAELQQGEAAAEAVKRADQAMYLAKRSGKNRVVAA